MDVRYALAGYNRRHASATTRRGAGCAGLPEPNRPDRPNRRAVHGAGQKVGSGGPEVRAGGSDDSPAWKAPSARSSRCRETVLHRPPARDFVSFMQQRNIFITRCCILPKAVLACRALYRRRVAQRLLATSSAQGGGRGENWDNLLAREYTMHRTFGANVFRSKPITHSSPNRSLIPFQADHRFQPMPITDSSPMPITFGVGTGTVRGV